jgi:hypothetical protein
MAVRPVAVQFRLYTLSSHGHIQEEWDEATICSFSFSLFLSSSSFCLFFFYSLSLYLLLVHTWNVNHVSYPNLTYHVLLMTLFITITTITTIFIFIATNCFCIRNIGVSYRIVSYRIIS